MQCKCGGVLIDGKSSHKISEDNFYVIIENIPAYKCQRCGKVLFDEETTTKIKKMANRLRKDVSEITTGNPSTNLYDYD